MEFLIIFEDGKVKQINSISKDDILMMNEGYCDIIRKQKYKEDFEIMRPTNSNEEIWEVIEKLNYANCEEK